MIYMMLGKNTTEPYIVSNICFALSPNATPIILVLFLQALKAEQFHLPLRGM